MGVNSSKLPTVPKEDLDYLLRRTNITSKEIKHWYRIYMKECPTGELNKEQFCRIYAEISPSGKANPLYEHIFRTYDQDNSGHIDFREFIEAINITRSNKPEDKLRMAFRLYDVDQNGAIEEKEMVEVMKALNSMAGIEMTKEVEKKIQARAKQVFGMVDKNNDGRVTIDELVAVCMRNPDVYNMVVRTSKTPKKKPIT